MKLLFLTNPQNGSSEEDVYLVGKLREHREHFDIVVAHPLECAPLLPSVEGVIIRNIWPTHEYREQWNGIKKRLLDSGLPTYNPLSGKADNHGKEYLVELYARDFPVIPSVDDIKDISKLPKSDWYWVKPKDGSDGSGAGKYPYQELSGRESALESTDHIIQPFEEFVSEPSFFFVDGKFSYAISMPNRLADRDIVVYQPTPDDIAFAQRFVDWDDMPYGIQRIDAVRTKDGRLLLTEDEDIAEYLYLLDLDEATRQRVTREIVDSITHIF